jgi:glycine dehydrogenase subunit 1
MIPYIPHTEEDRRIMLDTLGLRSMEELFVEIPEKYRKPELKLPPPISESEVLRELRDLASRNAVSGNIVSFLGAGAYRHFIPSAVDAIAARGEFLTSYTPYQPEASQGTLQAIFEYQSLIADLLGMDAVNASHYDGAAALAEGILLAYRVSGEKRKSVVISAAVHPEYRETAETYCRAYGISFRGPEEGYWKPGDLASLVDESVCCVVGSFPTFFGDILNYRSLCEETHRKGALFLVSVDPISLALFEPPGAYGADIVTGEGQCLGNPLSFGGPGLGIFAVRTELLRKMPGRLAGLTCDRTGKRGFVLTLNTREQHIRREKATSNICTNQGHVALRAAVYLSLMGKNGLRQVADLTYRKASYAAKRLRGLPEYRVLNEGPFFREFVLQCPREAEEIVERLGSEGIIPGLPLSRYFPDRKNDLLVCVTEMHPKEEIDRLIDSLAGI